MLDKVGLAFDLSFIFFFVTYFIFQPYFPCFSSITNTLTKHFVLCGTWVHSAGWSIAYLEWFGFTFVCLLFCEF